MTSPAVVEVDDRASAHRRYYVNGIYVGRVTRYDAVRAPRRMPDPVLILRREMSGERATIRELLDPGALIDGHRALALRLLARALLTCLPCHDEAGP